MSAPQRILRTDADFQAAIAAAPDETSRQALIGHRKLLHQQNRERRELVARVAAGGDPFAGVVLADSSWDEAF